MSPHRPVRQLARDLERDHRSEKEGRVVGRALAVQALVVAVLAAAAFLAGYLITDVARNDPAHSGLERARTTDSAPRITGLASDRLDAPRVIRRSTPSRGSDAPPGTATRSAPALDAGPGPTPTSKPPSSSPTPAPTSRPRSSSPTPAPRPPPSPTPVVIVED